MLIFIPGHKSCSGSCFNPSLLPGSFNEQRKNNPPILSARLDPGRLIWDPYFMVYEIIPI